MNEGVYILILVLVFAALYLNRIFGFLGVAWEGYLFHAELVLFLIYVFWKMRKS